MSKPKAPPANLDPLILRLAHKDGLIRQKARQSLVALGTAAVPRLTHELLNAPRPQVRWEAAKALVAIGDPSAIPSFVQALEDDDSDVAWLAVEGLIEFHQAAWPPLLEALINRPSGAVRLYEGAHHVFHGQKAPGFDDRLPALLQSLESESPDAVALAAYEILNRLGTAPPNPRR